MRPPFEYIDGRLSGAGVAIEEIAASVGTPFYLYSADAMVERLRAYQEALRGVPHRVCYAVKANSNLAVLGLLASQGAGFDVVSGGELYRVLEAGGAASEVVFSGVGKTSEEMRYALRSGVRQFNCESEAELVALNGIALGMGLRPRVALRVNPDVDAATHPYISTGLTEHKFGIPLDEAAGLYRDAGQRFGALELSGVSCHIGSQLLEPGPLLEAADRAIGFARELQAAGVAIGHLDLGGGLGVAYQAGEATPSIGAFAGRIRQRLEGSGWELTIEPGRSLVAEAGLLVTRVLYRKRNGGKEFVIVDGAMNDLLRPALYQAHHEILAERESKVGETPMVADLVGPVCESGDFFARGRRMPPFAAGELLALANAGAYGFVLSSQYNTRPRAAEVMAEGGCWRVVRERETWSDLVRGEVRYR